MQLAYRIYGTKLNKENIYQPSKKNIICCYHVYNYKVFIFLDNQVIRCKVGYALDISLVCYSLQS